MTATLITPRPVVVIAPARERPTRDPLPPDPPAFTPLFTRHMLGAIEADRDRRRRSRRSKRPRRTLASSSHPRLAAALAAERGAEAPDTKGTS
jgi:hypothetical protein